jgi:uracil-DNA glycosylase family 4
MSIGAHGSNRTGRPFTGDASGVWLYRALFKAGFSNQPNSTDRDDGLRLRDVYITAAIRCAPPQNKPTPQQRRRCFDYLQAEYAALKPSVIITLGKIADDTVHGLLKADHDYLGPRAPFKHGAETRLQTPRGKTVVVLASYHPSRQNTNTGVLTEPMLDAIFTRARELVNALGHGRQSDSGKCHNPPTLNLAPKAPVEGRPKMSRAEHPP